MNVGGFIFAALLLDVVLWLLVLLGVESVSITADFGRTHQLLFSFPYSHGLLASLVLLLLAFTVAGMTHAPAPPSGAAMAASSLLTIVVACALFGWLGRGSRR